MNVITPVETDATATLTRASIATYFDAALTLQTAAIDALRFGYDPATGNYLGALIEPARTNLLLNSAVLATQSVSLVSGTEYTLSFWGTGTVTLSGGKATSVTGTGVFPTVRTVLTFTPLAIGVTLTISGSVTCAQLEAGAYASSYIDTTSAPVTRAADVVADGLFYSDFTDATALYNAATTYGVGDVVRVAPRLYTSLVAPNLGNTPATSPTQWADTGPDNVFALFDRQVSTGSSKATPNAVVAIKISTAADSVALLNTIATSATVVVSDGASTFETVVKTSGLSQALFTGSTAGTIITVKLVAPLPSIGEFVCGTLNDIGATQYGARVQLVDYSRKTTDEFGVTTFVERPYSKRLSTNLLVEKADYNTVMETLFALRAKPTVWYASDDDNYLSGMVIYGFLRDMSSEISYPTHEMFSVEIEGLI